MTSDELAAVIQIKRKPPIWSVKAGGRYVATFLGSDARAQAEAYAATHFGGFTVEEQTIPAREVRHAEWAGASK